MAEQRQVLSASRPLAVVATELASLIRTEVSTIRKSLEGGDLKSCHAQVAELMQTVTGLYAGFVALIGEHAIRNRELLHTDPSTRDAKTDLVIDMMLLDELLRVADKLAPRPAD